MIITFFDYKTVTGSVYKTEIYVWTSSDMPYSNAIATDDDTIYVGF